MHFIPGKFTLHNVLGTYYLLPFGQAISDFRHGIVLNDTGVFLWNCILSQFPNATMDSVKDAMIAEYEPTPDEIPLIQADLEEFIDSLTSNGALIVDKVPLLQGCGMQVHFYKIAGITLQLLTPADCVLTQLNDFEIAQNVNDNSKIHPDLYITAGEFFQPIRDIGTVLVRTNELTITENAKYYHCIYAKQTGILEWALMKNGKQAFIHCNFNDDLATPEMLDDLFHAIRMIFLYIAAERNCFAMHSASICYQDKIWLFSGPSGTGKSTHTNLWHKLFATPRINGDLNLLEILPDKIMVRGIPWCGTSEIFTTKDYPLGGIILLRQDSTNHIETLSKPEQVIQVMQRLISPTWTSSMMERSLTAAENIIQHPSHPLVCRLACTTEDAAAVVMKDYIDACLQ